MNKLLILLIKLLHLDSFLVAKETIVPPANNPPPPPFIVPPPPTPPVPPVIPKYDFTTPIAARKSIEMICAEEGLMGLMLAGYPMIKVLIACIQVESGFNPRAVHQNKNVAGVITSTDYGIVQVNNFFHIGPGKDFPSIDFVFNNPEKCVRWMARFFKIGKANLWSSYQSKAYLKFL